MTHDYVHDHFDKHKGPVRPVITCADGVTLSVQASLAHYCEPRDDTGPWSEVEVWRIATANGRPIYPTSFGSGGREDPYGYVPTYLVNRFIKRHGGVAWLSKTANMNPQTPEASAFVLLLCKAIEAKEHLK